MEFSADKSFLEYFYEWEKSQPDKVFLRQPIGDIFKDFTWDEVGKQARKLATYLLSLNLPAKSNIGLVSKNCAEWIIADLGIMLSGHISVPFYPTLTADQLNQVLMHSESKVLFVGKLDNPEVIKKGIPEDVLCISFPTYNPDIRHVQWDKIMSECAIQTNDYKPSLHDIFSIIYTSGTTGNPKGVMLQYNALSSCIPYVYERLKWNIPETRFFSYLPLCHIAERNAVEGAAFITGGTIYFAESLDTFSKNLVNAHPTHFLAVPRIWTKFQMGILAKLPQKKLDLLLKIPIINSLIKKKIVNGLGLQDSVLNYTGAAPMPASLLKWYRKLGINIQNVYGMTENTALVSMTPADVFKDDTVGKIWEGVELRFIPDTGEICTRSASNMVGYFKEVQLTAETIDAEGWIHTGDVGETDDQGYLKITGRVKEMYKTSKGEYVAPAQIEMKYAENSLIEQICIIGQGLPQPIALVVLSETAKNEEYEVVTNSLVTTLTQLNSTLKSYERLHRIVIVKESWTVENNKMTPTMKLKRNVIEQEYKHKAEKWYLADETIIRE